MPTAQAPSPPARPAVTPISLPLGALALCFVAGSAALAAALGYALAWWWMPASPWMVGLASAFGVVCAALPLGAVLLGLARRTRAEPACAAESEQARPAELARLHGLALGREQFMALVGREWTRSRRYGTGAALLLIEIDRHARLAEVLGGPAAEKVLADLMKQVAPSLRGADALTRSEAGQLAVFLAHADATGALDVAERIRERAERMEVPLAHRRVRFTVSVGVAHLRPAHLHLQALFDDVAEAAAAARAVGGNCVRAAPVQVGPRPSPGAARDGHRADKG